MSEVAIGPQAELAIDQCVRECRSAITYSIREAVLAERGRGAAIARANGEQLMQASLKFSAAALADCAAVAYRIARAIEGEE